MTSRLAVQGIAEDFQDELARLRGQLDESVRESARMFAGRGRVPKGYLISGLSREALGGLVAQSKQTLTDGSRSRLVVESYGQDWIKVHFAGIGPVKLRKRPSKTYVAEPALVAADGATMPLFEVPTGELVLLWDWDASIGMLRSLTLARVASLEDWNTHGCVIFSEIEIESAMTIQSLPDGAGSDEDDLDDLVSRWDANGETDEPDTLGTTAFDEDEDEDHDEGDTTVGGAG